MAERRNLLLTRPQAQAQAFAAVLEARLPGRFRPVVAPLIAIAMSGLGKSIGWSESGRSFVQSVSFVCVCLSFATTPMSPACRRGTSSRSLPRGIDRWPSFSAPWLEAFTTSIPFSTLPLITLKKESSPTCGSTSAMSPRSPRSPSA